MFPFLTGVQEKSSAEKRRDQQVSSDPQAEWPGVRSTGEFPGKTIGGFWWFTVTDRLKYRILQES